TVNQCDLILFIYFFYHATATTDIYTLSLHDALPILIGQALVAACRTVDGRPPHSLHCYFLIGGDPKVPIIYEVDRIRDGKSFTRSEEHTSELQSQSNLVCRLLLEKKKTPIINCYVYL